MKISTKGFTLIELLIVVTIIGILAAIVIPNYINQSKKAYRASAQSALVKGAQIMERYFVRNNTYVGATIGNGAGDIIAPTTEGDRYALTFSDGPTASAFTLQATPQVTDRCGYLRLSQTGAKTSESCGNW